jgi:hypothetical protein
LQSSITQKSTEQAEIMLKRQFKTKIFSTIINIMLVKTPDRHLDKFINLDAFKSFLVYIYITKNVLYYSNGDPSYSEITDNFAIEFLTIKNLYLNNLGLDDITLFKKIRFSGFYNIYEEICLKGNNLTCILFDFVDRKVFPNLNYINFEGNPITFIERSITIDKTRKLELIIKKDIDNNFQFISSSDREIIFPPNDKNATIIEQIMKLYSIMTLEKA